VKPTPTSELIKDIRLPPDKGKNNKKDSRPSNRRSLCDDSVWATPPSSPLPSNVSGHVGAGDNVNKGDSGVPSNKDAEKVNVTNSQRIIPGISSNPNFRQRTESQKRKPSTEGNNNSKSARIEEPDCALLRTVHENNQMYERIMDDLCETVDLDHNISSVLRALTKGMKDSNDILGILLSERLVQNKQENCNPSGTVSNITIDDDCFPPISKQPANNSGRMKPLNQAPLGDGSWATVTNKKGKKTANNNHTNQNSLQSTRTSNGETNPLSAFNAAIKEAERSLLIFNLNMGQTPCMNPVTISNKITQCLLSLAGKAEGSAPGNPSTSAKEVVDDILGMVTKMVLFGSKTAPCKVPGKPQENGSFFTVPVKLMFKDKKTAQTAAEILRKVLKLGSTTPYHKSLRSAINLAIRKTRASHPGSQAKVQVDSSKKVLKCFIRPDVSNPGQWSAASKNFPIPAEALDPSSRNFSGMELPTSPVAKVNPSQGEMVVPNITLEQVSSQISTQTSSTQEKTNEVNSDDESNESSGSEMDSADSNTAPDPNLPPLPDFMSDNGGKDNKSKSPAKNPFRGSGNKVLRSPPPRPKVK
jgi:hypothetical protein